MQLKQYILGALCKEKGRILTHSIHLDKKKIRKEKKRGRFFTYIFGFSQNENNQKGHAEGKDLIESYHIFGNLMD